MAKVSHPKSCPIYDFGEADGRPYLVMEYVEGGDLRRRMAAGQPMPPTGSAPIVLPVGEALAVPAPPGDHPPRPEAREHPPARRRDPRVDRLRDRGPAGRRRRADPRRLGPGDPRVRRPRAAVRPEGGRAGRPVLAGGPGLRDAHRAAAPGDLQAPLAAESPRWAPRSTRRSSGPSRRAAKDRFPTIQEFTAALDQGLSRRRRTRASAVRGFLTRPFAWSPSPGL